jgi:hypothetical protein
MAQPQVPQLKLLDAKQGFELRLVGDDAVPGSDAGYSLELLPMDDGGIAATIMVEARGLSHTAVELSFSGQTYAVSEGVYGEWPDVAVKALSHKLELDKPGVLRYVASLKQATGAGVNGKFELLRVVLQPVKAKPA